MSLPFAHLFWASTSAFFLSYRSFSISCLICLFWEHMEKDTDNMAHTKSCAARRSLLPWLLCGWWTAYCCEPESPAAEGTPLLLLSLSPPPPQDHAIVAPEQNTTKWRGTLWHVQLQHAPTCSSFLWLSLDFFLALICALKVAWRLAAHSHRSHLACSSANFSAFSSAASDCFIDWNCVSWWGG